MPPNAVEESVYVLVVFELVNKWHLYCDGSLMPLYW